MPKTAVAEKKVGKEKKEKVTKEPKEKKDRGLGTVKENTLRAMKKLGGKKVLHSEIAEITDKQKGNQLRELTALGLIEAEIPEEGKREHRYSLTTEGRKVAAKL